MHDTSDRFRGVVPAFPYEGALFSFFHEYSGLPDYAANKKSYYAHLFGRDRKLYRNRAVALSCLFDEIIMNQSDVFMPDMQTYASGNSYSNPQLRLRLEDTYKRYDVVEAVLKKALELKTLRSVISGNRHIFSDEDAAPIFIRQLAHQVITAKRTNSVLMGNSFFQSVHRMLLPIILREAGFQDADGLLLVLEPDNRVVTSLAFEATDIESFSEIRQNKEITMYARHFQDAIMASMNSNDLEVELTRLMREAREKQSMAKHVRGAFQTVSSVAGIAGLVPIVGTVTGIAGLASDAASRVSERLEDNAAWYLIGPKMHEVAIKTMLDKKPFDRRK